MDAEFLAYCNSQQLDELLKRFYDKLSEPGAETLGKALTLCTNPEANVHRCATPDWRRLRAWQTIC